MEQIASMLESNFSKVFQELSELRREIASLKGGPAETRPAPANVFHQRTGNYSPEDVSIEKIFYAGKG